MDKRARRIEATVFLRALLISLTVSIVIGSFFGTSAYYKTRNLWFQQISNDHYILQNRFTSAITRLENVGRVLTSLTSTLRFAESNSEKDKIALLHDMQLISDNFLLLVQLRYLCDDGTELIKIDVRNGQAEVASGTLQNKKNRYFFQDGLKLKKSEIGFSNLDLLQENDKVVKPYIPTLRLISAIYNENNERKGLLVLNSNGQNIIDLMEPATLASYPNKGYQIKSYLINSSDHFIKAHSPDLQWGNDLKERGHITFSSIFPITAGKTANIKNGEIFSSEGFAVFAKISPQDRFHSPSFRKHFPAITFVIMLENIELKRLLVNSLKGPISWAVFIWLFILLPLSLHFSKQIALKMASEQLLVEKERRFSGIFNAAFQFIGLLSPDGTVLEANQTALSFAGITHEETIGKPFWECKWWSSQEAQDLLRESIQKTSRGEFVRYEAEVLGADNKTAIIDFSIKPVFDDEGTVVLLIPEGRDISQQKLILNELAIQKEKLAAEEQFRSLMEQSPDGILVIDAENYANFYANQAICKWLEYDLQNIRAIPPEKLFTASFINMTEKILKIDNFENRQLIESVSCLTSKGQIKFADVNISRMNVSNKTYLICFFRDTTEKKRLLAAQAAVDSRNRLDQEIALLNSSDDLSQIFLGALESISEYLGCTAGHAYKINPSKPEHILSGLTSFWYVSSGNDCSALISCCEKLKKERETSLTQTAGINKTPEWHLKESIKAYASGIYDFDQLQVNSALSIPICCNNEVLMIFEFFYRNEMAPSQEITNVLIQLQQKLELLIAKKRLELINNELILTLNSISEIIIIFDPDSMQITYSNGGATEQLGYNSIEMRKMTPDMLTSNLSAEAIINIAKPLKNEEKLYETFEATFKHKNGNCFPVEINLQYMTVTTMTPRFIIIARNIVYRKKALAKIRQQAAFMTRNPAPVFRVNRSGEVLQANSVARELLKKKLVGDKIQDHIPETAVVFAPNKLGSDYQQLEIKIKDAWYLLTLASDSISSSIYIFSSDITLRKKAESELEQLALVSRETQNVVVITDAEVRIKWVNQAFTNQTGFLPEEVIGKKPNFLHGSQTSPETRKSIRDAIRNRENVKAEIVNYNKNGEAYWMNILIQPIFSGDKNLIGFIAVESDITELKKIQFELIKARDEAEKASRAKSDFLANMSHEIRTPMNAIIGMTHLAMLTRLDAKQLVYVQRIQSAADSLLRILNDILDVSKIEAGKIEIENVDFSLSKLLNDLSQLVGINATEKNLELVFRIPEDLPEYVTGDSFRIKQILLNLISNSIKFTERGEIVVDIRKLDETETQTTISFAVIDTGIGISNEAQQKLFMPFSQADSSITRKFGGTGLGLTICNRLLNLMGSKLDMESSPGKGSRFSFKLDFPANRSHGSMLHKLPVENTLNKTILFLESNPVTRSSTENILTQMGFAVVACESLSEMLKRLQNDVYKARISVIMLDSKFMDQAKHEEFIETATLTKVLNIPVVVFQPANQIGLQSVNFDFFQPHSIVIKPATPSSILDALMNCFKTSGEMLVSGLPERSLKFDLSGICILLAEDNLVNREVAKEILEFSGATVIEAENGEKALELIEKEPVDIILMDLQMPVLDGISTTERIRENPAYKNLPIVALTANVMEPDQQACIKLGMTAYITKPFNPEKLLKTIADLFPNKKRQIFNGQNQNLNHRFPKLDGIDTRSGLRRLNGRQDVYTRILRKFAANAVGASEKIEADVSEENYTSAAAMAHSLKGVAGNIGAGKLFQNLSQFEASLRKGRSEEILQDLARVQLELSIVINSIASLPEYRIQEATIATRFQPLSFELQQKIANLKQKLEANDFGAIDFWHQMIEELKLSIEWKYLEKLNNLIGDLEFNQALPELEKLAMLSQESMEDRKAQ